MSAKSIALVGIWQGESPIMLTSRAVQRCTHFKQLRTPATPTHAPSDSKRNITTSPPQQISETVTTSKCTEKLTCILLVIIFMLKIRLINDHIELCSYCKDCIF